MDHFMIGVILLLGINLISRLVNEKATGKLEQDKKAALVDLFSKNRIYTFGIIIGIIVLLVLNQKLKFIDFWIAYSIYIVSVLCLIIVSNYSSYKKLKENDFPEEYIKSYLISTSLRFIGIVIFFAFIKF
ncbi:MAG TPA: hypothetical protein VL443_02635 [Cyclobacteriaceae bacterium]|nr:hypothetical protein [Cyclobacteriaceae bacterium]